MKLALAVLMIAVSAWGQSKPVTSRVPETCYDIDHWMPVNDKGSQPAVIAKYPCGHPEKRQCVGGCKPSPSPAVAIPKPHKPKPSVKKELGGEGRNGWGYAPELPCSQDPTCDSFGPIEPDKAAVPVEPTPSHVSVSAMILAKDGTLAVMLSDSEFSHLQQLRTAVAEEEKRLAVKHGADPGVEPCNQEQMCLSIPRRSADHYEYHGQFLLINQVLRQE